MFNPISGFHRADPELGWVGRPDLRRRLHRPEYDVVIEHTGEGFRRPQPAPPLAAAKRVLFLGDSFTWGSGVGQGELFTDHLQRALASDVAVANRGVNAYGTAQQYLLLQREFRRLRYDRIAVLFYHNDVGNNVNGRNGRRPYFALVDDRLEVRNVTAAPLHDPLRGFLRKHSRAFLFLSYRIAVFQSLRVEGREPALVAPDPLSPTGVAVTERLLAAMRDFCRDRGARFYLVYVPMHDELAGRASNYSRAIHALLEDVAEAEDIPLIDLLPGFRSRTSAGERLDFVSDAHWSPAGHRAAAEVLLASPLFEGWRPASGLSTLAPDPR